MCFTHPLYEGTTISVSSDSCQVTTSLSLPLQAAVYACDIPGEHAAAIIRRSAVPVIFSVKDEQKNPAIKELVSAVTKTIPAQVAATATTNFEQLCASKTLTIYNA